MSEERLDGWRRERNQPRDFAANVIQNSLNNAALDAREFVGEIVPTRGVSTEGEGSGTLLLLCAGEIGLQDG